MSYVPGVNLVLQHVSQSIYAEQVFCSIVTQMEFMQQFKNQPALRTVHQENYETSYHRNTAAGNLHRLLMVQDPDEILILMTVECFMEAKEHDKKAETALVQIVAPNPADDDWILLATNWHNRRKRQLRKAAKILYASIGPEMWQKGAALAE